jgi:hypothetical protein
MVQNYGITSMANLEIMGQVFARWMFQMDQPEYIVLGISQRNFAAAGASSHMIFESTDENLYISQISVDEYVTDFLLKNSVFFHYAILARSSQFVEWSVTDLLSVSFEKGGYSEFEDVVNCDNLESRLEAEGSSPALVKGMEGGFERFDYLLSIIQKWNVPVLVVNIPQTDCALQYHGFENDQYSHEYLEPIRAFLLKEIFPLQSWMSSLEIMSRLMFGELFYGVQLSK